MRRAFGAAARSLVIWAVLAATAPAQDSSASLASDIGTMTVSTPAKIVLTYTTDGSAGPGSDEPAGCTNGGARGGLSCGVTRRLSGGETQGADGGTVAARLEIPLRPEFRQGNQNKVGLTVGPPELKIRVVDSGQKAAIRREATRIVAGLRRWHADLSRGDTQRLQEERSRTSLIREPFRALHYFNAPKVAVSWKWAPETGPPDLSFVVKNRDGSFREVAAVARGVPFYIEARYRADPGGDNRIATLTWKDCPQFVALPLTRTGEDGKVFRSEARTLVSAVPATSPDGVLAPEEKFDALYGSWNVAYEDLSLGTVKGRAVVKPVSTEGGLKSVEVTFEQPGGARYSLVARRFEEFGEGITLWFSGRSPPSGRNAPGPGATTVELPAAVATVAAKLGGTNSEVAVVNDSLRVDLTTDLHDSDLLRGTWRYHTARDWVRYGRNGQYHALDGDALGEIVGEESWRRTPLTIDYVRTLDFGHDDTSGEARASVEILGGNLPVFPSSRIDLAFFDRHIRYTGQHASSPRDPSRLVVQVALDPAVDGTPKPLRLNGVGGLWQIGIPERQIPHLRFARVLRTDHIDAIDKIYMGEVFYLEAVYDQALVSAPQTFQVQTDANTTLIVTLNKVPETPRIMRSGPILLADPALDPPAADGFLSRADPPEPVRYPDGIRDVLRVPVGTSLTASRATDFGPTVEPARAVVVSQPAYLFGQALARANACYESNPSDFQIGTFTAFADVFRSVWANFWGGFDDAVHGKFPERRDFRVDATASTRVRPQSLAAALLIRDELERELSGYLIALTRQRIPPLRLAALLAASKAPPQYALMLTQKVPRRLAAVTGTMSPGADVPYLEALGFRRYFMADDGHGGQVLASGYYNRFIADATTRALEQAIKLVSGSLERTRGLDDCDVEGQLELVGWGVDPVVAQIMPQLFRPPSGTEPRYPRLLPDQVGRAELRTLATLANALRAQKAFGESNTDVMLLVATAVTAGGPLWMGRIVNWGGGLLLPWGRYYGARTNAAYAEGLMPVAGSRRYDEAQAEADAKLTAALISTGVLVAGEYAGHKARNYGNGSLPDTPTGSAMSKAQKAFQSGKSGAAAFEGLSGEQLRAIDALAKRADRAIAEGRRLTVWEAEAIALRNEAGDTIPMQAGPGSGGGATTAEGPAGTATGPAGGETQGAQGSPAEPAVAENRATDQEPGRPAANQPPGQPATGPVEGTGGPQVVAKNDLPVRPAESGGTANSTTAEPPSERPPSGSGRGTGDTQILATGEFPTHATGPGETQILSPGELPGVPSGPNGTQVLGPPDLPPPAGAGEPVGPNGTQVLGPPDLPPGAGADEAPTAHWSPGQGPRGTQVLGPGDVVGPNGTQVLEPPDLPPPAGAGEPVGPNGTQVLSPPDLPPPASSGEVAAGEPAASARPGRPKTQSPGARNELAPELTGDLSPDELAGIRVLPADRLGPRAVDVPWGHAAGSGPEDFRIASPLGELRVAEGPTIGQGAYQDVYRLVVAETGQDSGFVVKFGARWTGRPRPPLTRLLDADEVSNTFRGTMYGAGLLSVAGIPQLEVQAAGRVTTPFGDLHWIVQRRMGAHLPDGSTEVLLHSQIPVNGTASPEVTNKVLDLFGTLQRQGIAGEDLSTTNIFLRLDARGKVEFAGLVDQDRLARPGQTRYEQAPIFFNRQFQLQRNPGGYAINSADAPIPNFDNPRVFMKKMLEKQKYIAFERPGAPDAGFRDGFFDVETVCNHPAFSDLAESVPEGWPAGPACAPATEAPSAACPNPALGTPAAGSNLPDTVPPNYGGRLPPAEPGPNLPPVLPPSDQQGNASPVQSSPSRWLVNYRPGDFRGTGRRARVEPPASLLAA